MTDVTAVVCAVSFRFINFPDQPVVWREITVITAALRSDCQDKQAQFLRGEDCVCVLDLHEIFPDWVKC